MTPEEWQSIRGVFEKKATILLAHEGKEMAFVGLPSKNYTEKKVKGRRFITVSTNLFKDIVESDLAEATKQYSDHFGKNSTELVLLAINKIIKQRNPYDREK